MQYDDTQLGKWQSLETSLDLSAINGLIRVSATTRNCGTNNKPCYWDDLRFYPEDAMMTTYGYDRSTWQLTSITDVNNVTTFYEYDDAGRLMHVMDQDKKILSGYRYHYKDQAD